MKRILLAVLLGYLALTLLGCTQAQRRDLTDQALKSSFTYIDKKMDDILAKIIQETKEAQARAMKALGLAGFGGISLIGKRLLSYGTKSETDKVIDEIKGLATKEKAV